MFVVPTLLGRIASQKYLSYILWNILTGFFRTNEKLSAKISRKTARITYDAGVSENES